MYLGVFFCGVLPPSSFFLTLAMVFIPIGAKNILELYSFFSLLTGIPQCGHCFKNHSPRMKSATLCCL